MNRRSFLGFLSVAPVVAPMAAKAASDLYRYDRYFPTFTSGKFGGIDWSNLRVDFGSSLTRWERDARDFSLGVKNITESVSYAEKLPGVVSTVIEKTADLAFDHLTKLTEPAASAITEQMAADDLFEAERGVPT